MIFYSSFRDHCSRLCTPLPPFFFSCFFSFLCLFSFPKPSSTLNVKREVHEQYGLYNDSLKYAADYEMILRLLLKHKINISPMREVIVYMRAGGAGNKDIGTRIKVNLEDRRAWETVGLKPKWYTLHFKPLRKLWQYMLHLLSVKWLVHIPPTHYNGSFIYENSNQVAKVIEINSEKF